MARYVQQGHVRSPTSGGAISGATVTVYLTGTSTLATIYSASLGGSAVSGSQVSTNSDGFYKFYVDDGDYTIDQLFAMTMAGSGFDTTTFSDVNIIDVSRNIFTSGDTYHRCYVDASGVIKWGSGSATQDTNLYRLSADTLVTDDSFIAKAYTVTAEVATKVAYTGNLTGDTQARFIINSDGVYGWGSGSAAVDTTLYRVAANVLKSDDKFVATAGLGAGNTTANVNTPSGATARAMEIFDASGASLGFIPIYAAEW